MTTMSRSTKLQSWRAHVEIACFSPSPLRRIDLVEKNNDDWVSPFRTWIRVQTDVTTKEGDNDDRIRRESASSTRARALRGAARRSERASATSARPATAAVPGGRR
jgi:hypothetical protein